MNKPGRIIVISAPSGVGKGTIINEMRRLRPAFQYSISMTTRSPRPGEIDGVHYHFISRERFRELEENGHFLESSPYSEMGNLYGTPLDFVETAVDSGSDVILEIEVNGMRQVVEKKPDTLTFFILPESEEMWMQQLAGRPDALTGDEKLSRIETGRREMEAAGEYRYRVINRPGEAERAAREILDILDGIS